MRSSSDHDAVVVEPKGLPGNNCTILTADASRLAALLVGHMLPACSLLAPCDPGASTPRTAHLFPDRPLEDVERPVARARSSEGRLAPTLRRSAAAVAL